MSMSKTPLTKKEIEKYEKSHPDGISSPEVITIFESKGVKLSEATFRKYIQLGLLPRSKRIGRKGKYRGSRGIYPISIIRKINTIKIMMDEGFTLDDISQGFLLYQNRIEVVSSEIKKIFSELENEIKKSVENKSEKKKISKEMISNRRNAVDLLTKLEKISAQISDFRMERIKVENEY